MVAREAPLLINSFRSTYYIASVASQPTGVVRFAEDSCD